VSRVSEWRVAGLRNGRWLAGCDTSKRRLVIAAVLAGQSQSEVARTYGVSQGWISRLMARYRADGEAAFEPLSRAPKTSPTATRPETVALVLRLQLHPHTHRPIGDRRQGVNGGNN
jgi:transposase